MNSTYLIRDMPQTNRPRERLMELGADKLRTEELLAILLRTGTKGRSAVDIAAEISKQFNNLSNMASASVDHLSTIKGVGKTKAVTLKAAFELATRMARELRDDSIPIDSPERIAELLRDDVRTEQVERFFLVLLTVRRKLIRIVKLSQGTQDTLLISPREIFRTAILANAAAIALAHNHPSGDPGPSEADITVTRDLIRAGKLLKIDVLDHVILDHKTQDRPKDYVSLRELGYFFS